MDSLCNDSEWLKLKLKVSRVVNCKFKAFLNSYRECIFSLLETGAPELVIKAQILAGGRGKGTFDSGFKGMFHDSCAMNYELVLIICLGGVHLTKEPSEAGKLVQAMVGNRLTTKQTPPEGVEVQKVMIAHVCTNILPAYKFQAIIRLN